MQTLLAALALGASLALATMGVVACRDHFECLPWDSPEQAAWSRVVAALQQVAEEYPEAQEQEIPTDVRPRLLQLAGRVDEMSTLVGEIDPSDHQVRKDLEAIREGVLGTDYYLGGKCRDLANRIVERKRLPRTPPNKPDLARGQREYAASCAACHGQDRLHPSTIAGTTMSPPPADIWHPQYNWTPYETFNRVTYGGIETAMPSFEDLSVDERWDVVFYLFAERWPSSRLRSHPIGADELALLGDFELCTKFGYGAIPFLRREFLAPSSR